MLTMLLQRLAGMEACAGPGVQGTRERTGPIRRNGLRTGRFSAGNVTGGVDLLMQLTWPTVAQAP
jgi:hypothetical protein